MAMLRVTVDSNQVKPDEFLKKINFKFIKVKQGLGVLAEETASHMRGVIDANKQKPSNKKVQPGIAQPQLELSITAEKINDETWGVGNKSKMFAEAPYWAFVNYGGSTRSGRTHLTPGHYDSGLGKFIYQQGGRELMRLPSGSVIRHGMNFVEKTGLWLNTAFKVQAYHYWNSTAQAFKVHTV